MKKNRRMITAARDDYCIKRGWIVFPVPPGTKKSYLSREKSKTGRRWGASNNPDEVEGWFAYYYPEGNIGIPTGPENKIFVLETDTPEGHNIDGEASLRGLEAEHGSKLPETRIAISPSGSKHYYFNHPGGDLKVWGSNSKLPLGVDRLALGVDVKGDGNMVLAPPSVKPGVGQYRWLNDHEIVDAPAWLLELVCRSNAKAKVVKPRKTKPKTDRPAKPKIKAAKLRTNKQKQHSTVRHKIPFERKPFKKELVVGDDALRELEDACTEVAETEEGSRNDELNRQAFRIGQLIGGDRLDEELARERLTEAAEACGLGFDKPGEIEATIGSGLTAGMAQPRLLVKETWRQQLENEAAAALWSADAARRQLRRILRRIIAQLDDAEVVGKVWALRAATGLGKTQIIIELITPWLRTDPRRVLYYFVPRHELADKIVELFATQGIDAVGYRGRTASDPDRAGFLMCDDLDKVDTAIALGHNVQRTCCILKKKKENGKERVEVCRYFEGDDGCGFQRMLRQITQVWVLPANLLFLPQQLLPKPSLLVIDESFHRAGLRGFDKLDLIKIPLDALRSFDADLEPWRGRLRRLLQAQAAKLKGNDRRYLRRGGIARSLSAADCAVAIKVEKKNLHRPWIHPAISPRRLARINTREVRRALHIIKLWEELQQLLEQDIAASGRLELQLSKEGAPELHVRTIMPVHRRYRGVPTVIMDATLPGLSILRRFFPNADVVADLSRVQAPHARVRLITEAPVSSGDLEVELNRERLLHYVLWRWLEVGRGRALVTTQKEFAEWLSVRLPDEISVRHFNDLSGLDDYSGVRLLISVGRCAPPPLQMEAEAGALSGRAPETVTGPGYWWYPRRDHELQPGMIVKYCPYHPDQLVEAARWQPWEGLVVQAVGRARPINRTATNPVDIDILGNLPLPLAIDAMVPWRTPNPLALMLWIGVVLDSGADLARGWPEVWSNERAARRALEHLRAQFEEKLADKTLYRILYRKMSASSEQTQNELRPFRYRPLGRQRWRDGCFDPAIITPQSLTDLLAAKLGPGMRIDLEGQ